MASNTYNLNTWAAKRIIGDNSSASPESALLHNGGGRGNTAAGDTWIFYDDASGSGTPWGIKHDQVSDKISLFGNGTNTSWISLGTGNLYTDGKIGIGYDPGTNGNTYKLYVNGTSYFNNTITSTGNIYISNTAPHLYLQNTNWTKGTTPGANYYSALEFHTSGDYASNKRVGLLEVNIDTSNNVWMNIWTVPNVSGSTSWSGIRIKRAADEALTIYHAGDTEITGCLSIFPTIGNYREGIRIHSYSSWSDITLCGNDNTGNAGISANSWFIGNNNGNFHITRNGSSGDGSAYLRCVSNVWAWNGTATGNISGNAGTATKLETARTIWGQSFDGSADITGQLSITNADILISDSGTTTRQIRWLVGTNDYARIGAGATATNAGWMEIATADDGTEPIYVRQYTGAFATIKRTLTLLDDNGNTTVPQALGIGNTSSTSGRGLSLYNGAYNGVPEYGIFFGGTATFGKFGDVSSDWATYFTINRNDTRGWIFKSNGTTADASNNYASISGRGHFTGTLTPSSWIDGQRYMNAAYNIADYSNTGSYNPWMRATNTYSSGTDSAKVGRWFSFGTLGASFYWMGSVTTRTGNSHDYAMSYNVSNGILTATRMDNSWLRVVNNSSNNSDDAMVYLENKNSSDWAVKVNCDGYDYGLNIITVNNAGSALKTNGNMSCHRIWANQGTEDNERIVGVDNTTSGSLYLFSNKTNSSKGLYSGSGVQGDKEIVSLTTSGVFFYGHVVSPDAAVSYVEGAKGTSAAVFAKKTYNQNHWYPAVALQTKGGGAWQIGNYNDETLEFVYFPKDKIDSNTNSGQTEVYITSAGVFSGSISGNAATATKATQDGSGNVITSTYLKLSGGTMTGTLTLKANQYFYDNVSGINANNSDIIGINCLKFGDAADTFREGIMFPNGTSYDCLAANGGKFYIRTGTDGTPAVNATNANGTLVASAVWGNKVLINSDWVGFYAAIGDSTTRYGYVQANKNRMYFRKENGVSSYGFDFNSHLYTTGHYYASNAGACLLLACSDLTNVKDAKNGLSANREQGMACYSKDYGSWMGDFKQGYTQSNGQIWSRMYLRNYKTDGTQVNNYIYLYANKDGTTSYSVANAAAFRSAIGAGTSSLTIGTTATTAAAGNHTHTISQVSWPGGQNLACTMSANNQEFSIDINGNQTGGYWHVWSGKNSKSILRCYNDNCATVLPSGDLYVGEYTKNTAKSRAYTIEVQSGAGTLNLYSNSAVNGPRICASVNANGDMTHVFYIEPGNRTTFYGKIPRAAAGRAGGTSTTIDLSWWCQPGTTGCYGFLVYAGSWVASTTQGSLYLISGLQLGGSYGGIIQICKATHGPSMSFNNTNGKLTITFWNGDGGWYSVMPIYNVEPS